MIEEGQPAPDFELTSDSGETVKLSALRGKPVVLYFYPKDDTPTSFYSSSRSLSPGPREPSGESTLAHPSALLRERGGTRVGQSWL